MPFEETFELHALSHRVEFLGRRFYRPIIVCGVLGVVMLGMAVAFVFQKKVPFGAVYYLAGWTGIFGAAFLAAAIRWVPRMYVARFKDVVGRVAFDVVRERAYSSEFDAFVSQLQQFINESKEPNSGRSAAP